MKYEMLINFSGALLFFNTSCITPMVIESRYPLKKYLASLIPFTVVLDLLNFYLIFKYGFKEYGQFTILLATIPSLIYYFTVSKHRDGRFFFTFCLVDTCSIWFALLTGLIDIAIDAQGILNFTIRCISVPIIIYTVYKYIRKPFLNFTHIIDKGWWLFTALTGMVYFILMLLSSVPSSIRDRPEDVPFVYVMLIFMPLTYMTIFYVLFAQQRLHEIGTMQHSFEVQAAMMEKRAVEIKNAEEKIRIERHDLRHKLIAIEELLKNGETDKTLKYLGSIQSSLDETKVNHYCSNSILDVILSSYFTQAREAGIELETHLDFPDEMPVLAEELATVFANALENAINACKMQPPGERKLICTCIKRPTLMLEIKNTCKEKVKMDACGLPVSASPEHGIGTKSITAFCKKYNGDYSFSQKDGWFRLFISL